MAEKLSHAGFKTAYVEITPQMARPFPLLLGEADKKLKHFLQALGFLKLQKGGFCVLSPQGVWPLQDMRAMAGHCPVIKNALRRAQPEDFKDFSQDWLSRLSFNLSSQVFDGNLSALSSDRLNLFEDCYLFSPSLKKIKLFKRDHPDMAFYSLLSGSALWDEQEERFVKNPSFQQNKEGLGKERFAIKPSQQDKDLDSQSFAANPSPQQNKGLKDQGFSSGKGAKIGPQKRFEPESRKYIWLSSAPPFIRKDQSAQGLKPLWQWRGGFLKADFGDYESLIPSHFILIKDIFLPWSHDNLFSVFHQSGLLELWSRQAFEAVSGDFLSSGRAQLEAFFKGGRFSLSERQAPEGMAVFGPEALKSPPSSLQDRLYVEDLNLFSQGDLASALQAEAQLFEALAN